METIEIEVQETTKRTERLTVPAFRFLSGIYYKVISATETLSISGEAIISGARMDNYKYIPENFWLAQTITEAEFVEAGNAIIEQFQMKIAPKEGE